jgi:hypothetical protein
LFAAVIEKNNNPQGKNWLVNLFTGLSDGLIIPFALLAGMARIMDSSNSVTELVLFVIVAAALLMAAGGYFTTRDQLYEQGTASQKRGADLKKFYANIGFEKDLQEQAASEHLQEKIEWNNVSASTQDLQTPFKAAIKIFIGYIMGG